MRSFLIVIFSLFISANIVSGDEMCFEDAALEFGVPKKILIAISRVESNHNANAENKNKNGSIDYGHMQINSVWKKELKEKYNYIKLPCYNTRVGAWILNQCIQKYGNNYKAVACYHTGPITTKRKVKNGIEYAKKVRRVYESLEEKNYAENNSADNIVKNNTNDKNYF